MNVRVFSLFCFCFLPGSLSSVYILPCILKLLHFVYGDSFPVAFFLRVTRETLQELHGDHSRLKYNTVHLLILPNWVFQNNLQNYSLNIMYNIGKKSHV